MRAFLKEFGQWAGVVVVSIGVAYEVSAGAALGWAMVTSGSLIFAIGTKLRYKTRFSDKLILALLRAILRHFVKNTKRHWYSSES